MIVKLSREFFNRDPQTVAKDLIGCFVVKKIGENEIIGKIVETESYGDENDLASHARFGLTPRNKIMYGPPGILYVYQIYGIFMLANIISNAEGIAGAVLIRSAEIVKGHDFAKVNLAKSKFVKTEQKLATGPGKFSLAFDIVKEHNYLDITNSEELTISKENDKIEKIASTKRIGVEYAGKCKDYPWRYYLEENNFISKR